MGEDVEEKYTKELIALKMNSKPLINSLTMMAEDYIHSAPLIVQIIEKHLARVRPEGKLPVLYLIDSILKNIKKEYLELFSRNIVSTFCSVFEKVEDPTTRAHLFKLRQTWIDVFPPKKLMGIDMRCNDVDEKWPIGSNSVTTIHLNPKFLSPGHTLDSSSSTSSSPSPYDIHIPTAIEAPASSLSEVQMREELLNKQKQLLELQTKKLQLELLQAQAKLDEQSRRKLLEEQANAKLLAQAEIAKQKTQAATSMIAKANASQPLVQTEPHRVPVDFTFSSPQHLPLLSADELTDDEQEKKSKASTSSPPIDKFRIGGRSPALEKSSRNSQSPAADIKSPKRKSRSPVTEKKASGKQRSPFMDKRKSRSKSRSPTVKKSRSETRKTDREKERKIEPERMKSSSDSPRNGRKRLGIEEDIQSKAKQIRASDIDQRFSSKAKKDVDLRKAKDIPAMHVDTFQVEVSTHKKPRHTIAGDKRFKDEFSPKSERKARKAERERQAEREQFQKREKAVLSRNYRKRSGIEETEEEDTKGKPNQTGPSASLQKNKSEKDVDLRNPRDVQSSTHNRLHSGDHSGPSAKKARNSALIDNLFGREDVDLRPSSSSSWSQVKKPNGVDRRESAEDSRRTSETPTDEELKDILDDGKQRPPPALSPASSIGSTAPSTCDALGRPLAFARLPDDPEERRRSLGSRSASIDPIETFRFRYIETPRNAKGCLDASDLEVALSRCKEEVDQGILNNAQFNIISKQLVQLNEAIKIRQVQEMDMASHPGRVQNLPNPWGADVNQIWSAPVPGFPRGPQMMVSRPANQVWARPVAPTIPRGPNPFLEVISSPEILIPAVNQRELSLVEMDVDGTTPLDKISRQVRFYGTTAIVFVGKLNDEPKEISFIPENDLRFLFINREPIKIRWNVTRKFYFGNNSHNIRLGAPTRELYIDGQGYEVYFGGGPTRVRVDNEWVNFRLAGPPPGVKISLGYRYDLCAGRITIFLDGNPYNLYLDDKPQLLDFGGFPVIAKFCDEFRSIAFNTCLFPTNFGGPPRPVTLPNGRRFYIRFNAISSITEQRILAYVRFRAQSGQGDGAISGMRPRVPALPGFGKGAFPNLNQPAGPELPSSTNPLDMVANLLPSTEDQKPRVHDNSYEVEPSKSADTSNTATNFGEDETSSGPLNIQDLLSKLIREGLIPASDQLPAVKEKTPVPETKEPSEIEKIPEVTEDIKMKPEQAQALSPLPAPVPVVDVKFSDNLKKRRPKLISTLYFGIQCASCGLRFPTDQNYKYTQHLDWHFRHNRREKANARKALSRKWYYDLSDWIQFEEVEDLEERATSLFEPQDTDLEADGPGPRVLDPDSYTVLATGYEGAICPHCGEGFETFNDEEKEEWRLRDALLGTELDSEGKPKLFHPICHEDYINSLVEEEEPKAEEVTVPAVPEPKPEIKDDDEVVILREGPKEVVLGVVDLDIVEDEAKQPEAAQVVGNSIAPEAEASPMELEDAAGATKTNSSYTVIPPVVIDVIEDGEDSNIPGIASHGDGGGVLEGSIFGFALNSDSSHGATPTVESNPIVYEPMKFDFPKIKEEPVEWQDIAEDQIIMSTLFPPVSSGAEPMDITLDDEDESGIDAPGSSNETPNDSRPNVIPDIDLTVEDDVESIPVAPRPVVAEIDGNVQYRATDVVKSAPTKIKINIAGLDTSSQSPTHKSSTEESSQQQPSETSKTNLTTPLEKPQSPSLPDLEVLFRSEEMRLLKPKLAAAGKKLINNPVKRTGREESGLCSIM